MPTVNIKLSCPDEFQDRYTRFIDRARNERDRFRELNQRSLKTKLVYRENDFMLLKMERKEWVRVPTQDIKTKMISHSNTNSKVDFEKMPKHHQRMKIAYYEKNKLDLPYEIVEHIKKNTKSKKRAASSPAQKYTGRAKSSQERKQA